MSETQYHNTFNLGQLSHVRGRIGWKGLKSHEYTDTGPYLVAGTHIKADKIQWDKCQHINEFRYEESPEIKLSIKDIIISKDGTIGRVALVDYLPGPTTINSTMMLVRLKNQDLLCSEFIFYFLQRFVTINLNDVKYTITLDARFNKVTDWKPVFNQGSAHEQ